MELSDFMLNLIALSHSSVSTEREISELSNLKIEVRKILLTEVVEGLIYSQQYMAGKSSYPLSWNAPRKLLVSLKTLKEISKKIKKKKILQRKMNIFSCATKVSFQTGSKEDKRLLYLTFFGLGRPKLNAAGTQSCVRTQKHSILRYEYIKSMVILIVVQLKVQTV